METIYSKTLEILERSGWWQNPEVGGVLGINKDGRRCIMQAVSDASREMSGVSQSSITEQRYSMAQKLEAKSAVEILRKLKLGQRTTEIYAWNDAPGRKFADIRNLLMELHADEIKAMEIGEPQKEVEFVPLESPVEAPVEPAPAKPVETPTKEPVPAS